MKTIRNLEIVLASLLVMAAVSLVLGRRIAAFLFFAASIGLLVFLLIKTHHEMEIEDFLIRSSREKNRPQSGWNENEMEKLEQLRRRADFSMLQYQINPHFLYNTLDTIRGMALINHQEEIAEMTRRLALFFRYTISNKDSLVRVEEELLHIQDYYFIQRARFGSRFEMELLLEEDDINNLFIPKLILQPLVENSVMHGLEQKKEGGKVRIEAIRTQNNLILKISDNGAGMSEEKLQLLNQRLDSSRIRIPSGSGRNNGIALQNVNARLRIIFGKEYGLHYRSEIEKGTVAVITVPIVDEFSRTKYEDLVRGYK